MNTELLAIVYKMSIERGGEKSLWLENRIGECLNRKILDDDVRNERELYENLFSFAHKCYFESLYFDLLISMKELPFDSCGDRINAAMALQEIVATALWKYNLDVGDNLEAFAREYDRLDLSSEKLRFYEQAKNIMKHLDE